MRVLVFLLLSLTVRDVFSLPGQFSAEVSILGEGDVPSDTKPQVTCTISSIEPAGTDVKFEKYIASSDEVAAKLSSWRNISAAQTFEECATAAAASASRMFLFDEQMCQISDDVYERSDYCGKDHSQMVYMNADEATPTAPENDPVEGFFCNVNWTVSCITGRCINHLKKYAKTCNDKIDNIRTAEGRYHVFDTYVSINVEDQYAECEKFGAQPCAPADEQSISGFLDDLEEGFLSEFIVGLNSTDGGNTYKWATGVPMPKNHPRWRYGETFDENCVTFASESYDEHLKTLACHRTRWLCCMIPYYAN